MSTNKKIFLFLFAAPLLAVLMASFQLYYILDIQTYDGKTETFTINSGEGFSSINYRLRKNRFISNANVFHRYNQVTNQMTKFKAGQYEIKTGSTMLDIIGILTSGKSIASSITIPEGKNLYEIAKILATKNIIKEREFIDLAKSSVFAEEMSIPGETVEGYLYPDTYRFSKNTTARKVIQRMIQVFRERTSSLDIASSTYNLHQIVTLASIVEKETGAKHERPRIAGVFHNRLKKKMRLQSDPTTIYGIFENFNGNLRKKHLLEKTPYNTYRISGLPKGPISNPGIESLKAVINPEIHNYLYFVSQNDGTHVFSTNYKDHQSAVRKYQLIRKNRKGKSWRDLKQNQ